MSSILTIGERIANLRKLRKYSQASLAEEIGRTRSAIAQIETNAMRPDYEFIRDIVRILNTTYEYIFGEASDPEKGVRYFDEKGGKVKGKVSADIKNDLYIKSDKKGNLYQSGEDLQAGVSQEKSDLSLSDVERAGYSDLKDLLKRSISTQETVMIAIMSRLEALERRLIDPDQAELP